MFWFTRKKFVGIVLLLDRRQAVIVLPEGGFDAILALFHHEIDVGASGRVRMQGVKVFLGPFR